MKVRIPAEIPERDRKAVHALLHYFDGVVPAYVYENGSRASSMKLSVHADPILSDALVRLLGPDNVKIEAS